MVSFQVAFEKIMPLHCVDGLDLHGKCRNVKCYHFFANEGIQWQFLNSHLAVICMSVLNLYLLAFRGQIMLWPCPDWSPLGVEIKVFNKHPRKTHIFKFLFDLDRRLAWNQLWLMSVVSIRAGDWANL